MHLAILYTIKIHLFITIQQLQGEKDIDKLYLSQSDVDFAKNYMYGSTW